MAWRVSCAALCTADTCEKPNVKTMVRPINKLASPAVARCDRTRGAEIVVVVMFTLRETVFGRVRPFCSAGLLTCGVLAFGAFPVSSLPDFQWQIAQDHTAHSCGGSHGIGP